MSLLRLFSVLIAVALCSPLFARDVPVKGYTRKDGTYVAPHMRSAPNSANADNWSTKGNVNPYTGELGTKQVSTAMATSASSHTHLATPVGGNSTVIPSDTAVISNKSERAETPVGNDVATSPKTSSPTGSLDLQGQIATLLAAMEKLTARIDELERRLANKNAEVPQVSFVPPELRAWRQMRKGMSKAEVRDLLGEPLKASSDHWYYSNTSLSRYVGFLQERVFNWTE